MILSFSTSTQSSLVTVCEIIFKFYVYEISNEIRSVNPGTLYKNKIKLIILNTKVLKNKYVKTIVVNNKLQTDELSGRYELISSIVD